MRKVHGSRSSSCRSTPAPCKKPGEQFSAVPAPAFRTGQCEHVPSRVQTVMYFPAFGYGAPHPSGRGTSTLLNNLLPSARYGLCWHLAPARRHRPFRREARSPQVRTQSFAAQPSDLRYLILDLENFAVLCLLALMHTAFYPVLVHRLAVSLRASSPRLVALTQLRFTTFAVVNSREDYSDKGANCLTLSVAPNLRWLVALFVLCLVPSAPEKNPRSP